jgi:transposase
MRYELNDYEWSVIKPMLPNKPRGIPRVALSRYRHSGAVNVGGNRRHAAADAPAQVRNEPARSSLKCGRRSR